MYLEGQPRRFHTYHATFAFTTIYASCKERSNILHSFNPSFYPSEMNLNPPDIGVKLSVKRLHLVIHGHHLALKVSCLISGAGVKIQVKIEPSNLPRH